MLTTPIRKKEDINLIKEYYLKNGKYRDYALFVVGINTSLRISDILNMRWNDIYDFEYQRFREHLFLNEQKTGKKIVLLSTQVFRKLFYCLWNTRLLILKMIIYFVHLTTLKSIFQETEHGIS